MRLVDADALQMQIDEYAEHIRRLKKGKIPKAELAVLLDCKGCVDNAPTVDAVPVVHGRWIIRDNPGTGWYRITCSECGEDVTATAPCIGFFPNAKVNWNYCPECGADMRGEEEWTK